MAPRFTSWLARPALIRTLVIRLRVAARLLREPTVPVTAKALTLVPLLYVLSPLDLLPDVIPVLGQLDDLGVIIAAVELFLGLCPSPAVAFHQRAVAAGQRYAPMHGRPPEGDVMEAEWRRE